MIANNMGVHMCSNFNHIHGVNFIKVVFNNIGYKSIVVSVLIKFVTIDIVILPVLYPYTCTR
jgi:hypothetical protein